MQINKLKPWHSRKNKLKCQNDNALLHWKFITFYWFITLIDCRLKFSRWIVIKWMEIVFRMLKLSRIISNKTKFIFILYLILPCHTSIYFSPIDGKYFPIDNINKYLCLQIMLKTNFMHKISSSLSLSHAHTHAHSLRQSNRACD